MQYKAYIFDVDGTLLAHGQSQPDPNVQTAIINAQKRGAKIVIATGRPFYSANSVLGKIKPDYYVLSNGALVTNGAGDIISEKHFIREEMYALCDYADNYTLPLAFIFDDSYYLYSEGETIIKSYASLAGFDGYIKPGENRDRHLINLPYSACIKMSTEHREAFLQKYAHLNLRLVPFGNDNFHDVFNGEVNKAVAACSLMSSLGIEMCNTAAFGDGHNDLELARAAKTSVCVGNSCAELAEIASVHTDILDLYKVINLFEEQ